MDSVFSSYSKKDKKAFSLFPYTPDIDGICEKARDIKDKTASYKLCNYLEQYNTQLGCDEKTLKNIALLRKGAKVIMTGQQCGLLGGPLYSIYKALTAVKLAEHLSQTSNQDVVAVFWVADEDHDWQEINNTTFLNQYGSALRHKIHKDIKDLPAYEIVNDDASLGDIIKFIKSLGLDTEYLPHITMIIEKTYDNNYSTWFAKIIAYLFKEHGLILVDSKAQIIKEQGEAVFQQMLEQRDEVTRILAETSREIQHCGYFLQNSFDPEEETNLFILKDRYRYKLKKNNQAMAIKTGEIYNIEDIRELIYHLKVSPNVFLRPVIQDCSFPTIAYVGGPGEINYMAQITGMYQYLLGEKLPVIFPRQSFMIIEPAVKKILERYSLNYPHIHSIDSFRKGLIHSDDWANIEGDFHALRTDIIHQYTQLIDKISTVNPQLSTIGDKNLQLILNQVDFLQSKTLNFHKENNSLMLRHFERLENSLFPLKIEQQRILNVFYYLIKYNNQFLHRLTESIDLNNFELQYIEI